MADDATPRPLPRRLIVSGAVACLLAGAALGWFAGVTTARTSTAGEPAPASSWEDPRAAHGPVPGHAGTAPAPFRPPAPADAGPATREALATHCTRGSTHVPDPGCTGALDAADLADPAVREAVLALLAAAPTAAAKAGIFNVLQPVPLASKDLAPLLEALRAVHDAGDPALRGTALVHWAQWDRSDRVAPLLRAGLYDGEPQVVRGAITAVALSNVRTQELKEALLLVANDAAPDSEARVAALQALRDFGLSRSEYAIFRDSETAVPDGVR